MSKHKVNIRPDLVGELFLKPGEDIPYRLLSCDSEPRALLAKVTEINVPNIPGLPLSQLSEFVHLKPERPRERKLRESELPTPAETRGIAKPKKRAIKNDLGVADKKGDNLTIHVLPAWARIKDAGK